MNAKEFKPDLLSSKEWISFPFNFGKPGSQWWYTLERDCDGCKIDGFPATPVFMSKYTPIVVWQTVLWGVFLTNADRPHKDFWTAADRSLFVRFNLLDECEIEQYDLLSLIIE